MSEDNKNNNYEDIDEILKILDEYSNTEKKDPETTQIQPKVEDLSESSAEKAPPEEKRADIPENGHFTDSVSSSVSGDSSMLAHFSASDNDDTNTIASKDELTPIPKRKKKHRGGIGDGKIIASSLFKAIMYIVFVLAVSAYCAYYIIVVANDVFAFEKPDAEYTLTVAEGLTTDQLAVELNEMGIISYPKIFSLYVKYKIKEEDYIAGNYAVSPNMNYEEIVSLLTTVPYTRVQVSVTIPEGYTTDQIIDLLVEKGVGDRSKFIEVINNYPFKHDFISKLNELTLSANRTYRLDGYLFPDTYFFYQDDEEVNVINKFLNNFENKYEDGYYDRCEKLGMTFDELITLASMIQAEAKLAVDFEYISGVFHNRLNSSSFVYLESDATVQYCLNVRNVDLTQEDLEVDNPYNTYKYKGLPPGAICNPGIDAITAALYPDDPLDNSGASYTAYYFVSNKYGKTYYASTNKKHEQNKKQVAEDNIAYEAAQKPEEESENEDT
ncbi:MAG TPA: endolytic transglycosylase MltG [Bacillota bacterium]|nr:endolytic transglycosylase MltG [Bacillota bacterium]